MGNAECPMEINEGIREYVAAETERVKRDKSVDFLTLSELLDVHPHEDYPINFRHLGALFVCDYTLDGVFDIADQQHLIRWVQLNMGSVQLFEFRTDFQAKATTKLIERMESTTGQHQTVLWISRLLLRERPPLRLESQVYIRIDGLRLFFEIFNVATMSDLDIQAFFSLMRSASRQMGFEIEEVLENDEEEEYIALGVCQRFAGQFIQGSKQLLKDVGFSSYFG